MDMITLGMLNSMKKSGGVGYTDTTTKTANKTVALTKAGSYYRWDMATPYSDNGITEFSGTKATGTGSMWYSDVFEHDTVVTVTVLYGTTNANLRQYCACIPADTEIPASNNFTADVHYMEQIGSASTAAYTVQYTVRSGYRLAVINWNSGTPSNLSATADVLTMEETIHPIDPKFLPGVCLPVVELSAVLSADYVQLTENESTMIDAAGGAPIVLRFQTTLGEDSVVSIETLVSSFSADGVTMFYSGIVATGQNPLPTVLLTKEAGTWFANLEGG